jgi:hypothetical protein
MYTKGSVASYGIGTSRRVALIEPDFPAMVYSIMLLAILRVCRLTIPKGSLERGSRIDGLIQRWMIVLTNPTVVFQPIYILKRLAESIVLHSRSVNMVSKRE